jgi:hypothetical protein
VRAVLEDRFSPSRRSPDRDDDPALAGGGSLPIGLAIRGESPQIEFREIGPSRPIEA